MAYNADTMSFSLPETDTVYIEGLPPNTSEAEVEQYFGSIGIIKTDKKTRGKKIWLYRDKGTGQLKGCARVCGCDRATQGGGVWGVCVGGGGGGGGEVIYFRLRAVVAGADAAAAAAAGVVFALPQRRHREL
jgi:hypothetical protein